MRLPKLGEASGHLYALQFGVHDAHTKVVGDKWAFWDLSNLRNGPDHFSAWQVTGMYGYLNESDGRAALKLAREQAEKHFDWATVSRGYDPPGVRLRLVRIQYWLQVTETNDVDRQS